MSFTFWKGEKKNDSQGLSKLTRSWPERVTILFHSLDSSWSPQNYSTSSVTFWGLLSFMVNYYIQCKSLLGLREISASKEYGTAQMLKSGIDEDFEDKVNCVFLLTK